jgi:hypothetical protein
MCGVRSHYDDVMVMGDLVVPWCVVLIVGVAGTPQLGGVHGFTLGSHRGTFRL